MHFRFNAGSRIIENNSKGRFFLFLAPAGGDSNITGPYIYPFHNPAGQSSPLLNLTCYKISMILLLSTILTSNILPEIAPDSFSLSLNHYS